MGGRGSTWKCGKMVEHATISDAIAAHAVGLTSERVGRHSYGTRRVHALAPVNKTAAVSGVYRDTLWWDLPDMAAGLQMPTVHQDIYCIGAAHTSTTSWSGGKIAPFRTVQERCKNP